MPARTSQAIRAVYIFSTSLCTFAVLRIVAVDFCIAIRSRRKRHTSVITVPLISSNTVIATGSSGFPPCKSTRTCNPSLSLFTSINHLVASAKTKYSDKEVKSYRGLSGKANDPTARIIPIMHCTKSGIRHDKSESKKEQK